MDQGAKQLQKAEREHQRQRSYLGAKAIFAGGFCIIDCLVRDISAGGAKVILDEALALPPTFELYIPMQSRRFQAEVRWRTKTAVGVKFV